MESEPLINDATNKSSYDSTLFSSSSQRLRQLRAYLKFENVCYALHTFLLLLFLALTTLWIQAGSSMYIPMYSKIALSKGLSDTEIGLIMGLSPFVCFIIYPFVNVFVNKGHFKLIYVLSSYFLCGTLTLFGLLIEMYRIPFELFSLIFPFFQALALSLMFLSSYAIMLRIFPKYRTFLIAVSEVFIGLGYTGGPPIGGVLYDYFGYVWMFIGSGVFAFILASITTLLLWHYKLSGDTFEDEGKEDYLLALKMLIQPDLAFFLIVSLVGALCFNYFVPVLGPFLSDRYGVDPAVVGFVFLSGNCIYVLMSPVLGCITDKIKYLTPFIALGLIIQSAGTVLVPPSSLISEALEYNVTNATGTNENLLIFSYVGMSLIGFGYILSYLPILAELMNRSDLRFPNTANVTTTITALFVSIYYLGEGSGPLIAGFIAQFFDLDVVIVYVSGMLVLFAVLTLFFMLYDMLRYVIYVFLLSRTKPIINEP